MTEAPPRSSRIEPVGTVRRVSHEAIELTLPAVDVMLAEGGDHRLALDPVTGRNRYGCSATPDPGPADFGSATASIVSPRGFAAASDMRQRLADRDGREPRGVSYARELELMRQDLRALCGLQADGDTDIIFAASGTDLHLSVAELVCGPSSAPTVCICVEPWETGSGVPAALEGRHFSGWTALGAPVHEGGLVGAGGTEVVALSARGPDGRLRPSIEVEAELDAVVKTAVAAGRRVLLSIADTSKTGLISPGLDVVSGLRERFGDRIEVLVDACQFRLSPKTIGAYLDLGFLVAVTGSKFLAGPSFSGALLVPAPAAERLRARLPRPGLRAYSARGEWPTGWVAGAALTESANYGLLLRWEAALSELRAFRAIPEADVETAAQAFAAAVRTRLESDPRFEALETRPLDRSALGLGPSWDCVPTVFPFLLRHDPARSGGLFSLAAHQDVYRGLMARRVRLGQPVLCGERGGRPISALRLCNSARLIAEAAASGPQAVIDRAMAALDSAADAAEALSGAGRV